MLRKLMTNPITWLIFVAASLALHTWWALQGGVGADFARGGALLVLAGVAITSRQVLRLGFETWFGASQIVGGGSYVPTPEEIEEARQQERDTWCAQVIGPLTAVVGTLIWAYGDIPFDALIQSMPAKTP